LIADNSVEINVTEDMMRTKTSNDSFDIIYTPESELKRPLKLLRTMLNDLLSSWSLSKTLLKRDINAKYRQSILGYLWAFLPSLFTALAFTLANNSNTIQFKETEIPYPAFVIFSMVIWQTLVEAINGPVQTISESKVMLAKINFKREALILSKFLEVWVNFLIKLVLIAGVFIHFGISVSWTVVFVPFGVSILILLGILIGLLLSPLSLLYKDVSYGLAVFINFFLFITPVIFPKPTSGKFATLVNLNPVTHIIEAIRKLTLNPDYDFTSFYLTGGIVLVFTFVAWMIFRLAMPFAIERVTS
jgi:lipopolysaccharide transport system permease protein